MNEDWVMGGLAEPYSVDPTQVVSSQVPEANWPEAGPLPGEGPSANDIAAMRLRAPYRNRPSDTNSNLPAIGEALMPKEPWEYGLAVAAPGNWLGGRAIALAPKALRAATAAGLFGISATEAEAGKFDPRLWSSVSNTKLVKPLDEMEHVTSTLRVPAPKFVDPQKMLGGWLLPHGSDLSATNREVQAIDLGQGASKLDYPVTAHGGIGFPEANPGMAWASQRGAARALDNRALALAETGKPVYTMPFTMAGTGIDASHHIADPAAQLVQQAPISSKNRGAFNDMMRESIPDWVNTGSKKFRDYITSRDTPMGAKTLMADRMALKEWQDKGFPNIGAIRHAMSDEGLLDVPRNTMGMSISRYTPGQGLLKSSHPTYDSAIAGEHQGQWAHLTPFDVAAPDIAAALAERNARNMAAGKKVAIQPYKHFEKPTSDVPTAQYMDDKWLEGIMRHWKKQQGG
jgi:hypothetical protein